MTQGAPPPPPEHIYMSGALPPMEYGNISPMQQGFNDPFLTGARKSRQMDYEDLPRRVSTMDLGDGLYVERTRSQSRKRSMSRPALKRTSTTSSIPVLVDYELWRFEKVGNDWNDAVRDILVAPQKELAKKAKSGKSKNGRVLEQMQTMPQTRSGQIYDLVEKKYKETGFSWEPAYIEEVKVGMNRISGKKDVRVFDVIVARVGINSSPRASLVRARTNSVSIPKGERVILSNKNTDDDSYGSDKGDKGGKKGKDKNGWSGKQNKEYTDPDPFGSSKLFANSGKPLDPDGGIPIDQVHLPPHIQEEEPIGRRVEKKRSGSRGGKSHHGGDDPDGIQVMGDDGTFQDGGAEEILNGIVDFDSILPKGKKGKKGGRSRSRSRSKATARNRSRSKSRARAHNEHRSRGPERVGRYMDDSSVTSDGSGHSNFMMDEDDISSLTSSSIHREMAERGSLHRRGSSKYKDMPFRAHYRGPQKGYPGEQIIIPEGRIRRLSTSYQPRQKQIGYGEPYISGQRSPSPRRSYGGPGLLWPQDLPLREADERSEHFIDNYMSRDRLVDYRERELDERERAIAKKERALQRVITQGYGHVRPGHGRYT